MALNFEPTEGKIGYRTRVKIYHVRLEPGDVHKLKVSARLRKMNSGALLTAICQAVIRDKLINAVLEE